MCFAAFSGTIGRNMKLLIAMLLALVLPTCATAACYTVYDKNDRVLFQDSAAPVDLSRPISEQVRATWPDGNMVMAPDSPQCVAIDGRRDRGTVFPDNLAASVQPDGKRRATAAKPYSTALVSASNVADVLSGLEDSGVAHASQAGNSGGRAGGSVYVHGYYRANGTFVAAHWRAAPGTGRGASSGHSRGRR